MLIISIIIILLCASLLMYGALNQKNDFFIKLLFLNSGTTITSLFICFFSTFTANNSYIDIALIYFLLGIIATAAYLKYFLQKIQNDDNRQDNKIIENDKN